MKIVSYRLYESVVHCRRPFKIATGIQDACRTLVLELTSSTGARGHGEAVPLPLAISGAIATRASWSSEALW